MKVKVISIYIQFLSFTLLLNSYVFNSRGSKGGGKSHEKSFSYLEIERATPSAIEARRLAFFNKERAIWKCFQRKRKRKSCSCWRRFFQGGNENSLQTEKPSFSLSSWTLSSRSWGETTANEVKYIEKGERERVGKSRRKMEKGTRQNSRLVRCGSLLECNTCKWKWERVVSTFLLFPSWWSAVPSWVNSQIVGQRSSMSTLLIDHEM